MFFKASLESFFNAEQVSFKTNVLQSSSNSFPFPHFNDLSSIVKTFKGIPNDPGTRECVRALIRGLKPFAQDLPLRVLPSLTFGSNSADKMRSIPNLRSLLEGAGAEPLWWPGSTRAAEAGGCRAPARGAGGGCC